MLKVTLDAKAAISSLERLQNYFKKLETQPLIGVVKNVKPTKPHDIQAITGATISSQAVVNILNDYIKRVKETYSAAEPLPSEEVSQIN